MSTLPPGPLPADAGFWVSDMTGWPAVAVVYETEQGWFLQAAETIEDEACAAVRYFQPNGSVAVQRDARAEWDRVLAGEGLKRHQEWRWDGHGYVAHCDRPGQ